MNRERFLAELRAALDGLQAQEINDIVADYAAYFAEGGAAGRSEVDIATALGDPGRIAKELRAEAGLKRWESKRTPRNFIGAVFALFGLAAVDLFILLPALCIAGFGAFITGVVLVALVLAGGSLMASPFWALPDTGWAGTASVILAGAGLISGSIGWGAVLLLVMEGVLLLLGKYARLHYRLTKPDADAA